VTPPPRTAADVRLEVAAARNEPPAVAAATLRIRRDTVRQLRGQLAGAVLDLARQVDRLAAAHGEQWTLEALALTEDELLELCRAQTPNLAELADPLAPATDTEPRT
jgi:hypothetical protein